MYKWRDSIAREKDESLGFVLPNHMLLMIAETLPKEMSGILACCDPVPSLLQTNLGVIHRVVTAARNLPLHEVCTDVPRLLPTTITRIVTMSVILIYKTIVSKLLLFTGESAAGES